MIEKKKKKTRWICFADEAEASDLHHVDEGMDDRTADEPGEMSGKSTPSFPSVSPSVTIQETEISNQIMILSTSEPLKH